MDTGWGNVKGRTKYLPGRGHAPCKTDQDLNFTRLGFSYCTVTKRTNAVFEYINTNVKGEYFHTYLMKYQKMGEK